MSVKTKIIKTIVGVLGGWRREVEDNYVGS